MEIKKNLLRSEKKSYLGIAVGVGFFIISIVWIVLKIRDGQKISLFDWFYVGIFALNGISHTMVGFGFRMVELFGKAFILINKEKISLKAKVLEKEQTALWSEIHSVNYNFNKLYIHKTDNTTLTFNLSEIDYAFKNEIKEFVKSIANEKQIIVAF
ncbi:hypothetical protein Palpr_2034 [Paludibacter propionicigenes WB4]|uniref:Uncharacterized protein n=1 Tax=Paludibacter propionicigenes (strain DSM 17365 / JCM 13257 / WB4) TaxID=694427 RepID=E4T627_PALPW|nr:hypothetical protein [Paludibacter propionicigenes]ADQ80171.1 hypothetical protein Palpr_2034 [Paludibacter propionicigenes WB4]